jgi:hypothetical protein
LQVSFKIAARYLNCITESAKNFLKIITLSVEIKVSVIKMVRKYAKELKSLEKC